MRNWTNRFYVLLLVALTVLNVRALTEVERSALSIEVVPFTGVQSEFVWKGQRVKSAEWITMLTKQVTEMLGKSGSFRVSPHGERSVYRLEGSVRAMKQTSSAESCDTKDAFAEVSYWVRLASTKTVKWTDTVQLDAASFAASNLVSFVGQTSEAIASSIVDALKTNLLPYRIVGRSDDGCLIIDAEEMTVRAGEFLTVFARGKEIKDEKTGKVLDYVEEAVGTVQIVRISPKVSFARVVEGDASKMVVGSCLRRVSPRATGLSTETPDF